MSLGDLIAKSVRCAKCGAQGVGNCDCWLLLRCGSCGQQKHVERVAIIDPPRATLCITNFCNKCERGDENEDMTYYDAAGSEISADPESWYR